MAITNPTVLINEYLSEKLGNSLSDTIVDKVRFFPSGPIDITAITDNFTGAANDVFVVYDRMFKMRKKAFPHIKCEQSLYYFYKTAGDPEQLFDSIQIVHDLLDREDESGEELNAWIQNQVFGGVINVQGKDFKPVYFHSLKVYQLQEVRDIINHSTTRTLHGVKLIVDYEYHTQDYNN
jgi:hypothetical protein